MAYNNAFLNIILFFNEVKTDFSTTQACHLRHQYTTESIQAFSG